MRLPLIFATLIGCLLGSAAHALPVLTMQGSVAVVSNTVRGATYRVVTSTGAEWVFTSDGGDKCFMVDGAAAVSFAVMARVRPPRPDRK